MRSTVIFYFDCKVKVLFRLWHLVAAVFSFYRLLSLHP